MIAAAWMLFVVFCPIDDDCSIHYARFPREIDCRRALHELAQPVEPDGEKSMRLMLCTQEARS